MFPPLSIACYDVYDNQIPFATTLEVAVKVQTDEGLLFHVEKFTKEFSNHTLTVKVSYACRLPFIYTVYVLCGEAFNSLTFFLSSCFAGYDDGEQ